MYSRAVTFLVENEVGLSKGTLVLQAKTALMLASLGDLFVSNFILYLHTPFTSVYWFLYASTLTESSAARFDTYIECSSRTKSTMVSSSNS